MKKPAKKNEPVQKDNELKHDDKIIPQAIETSTPSHPLLSDKNLKNFFFFSLLFMLVVVWVSGWNIGYHQDEMDMNNYGKANLAYYMSGGKDTSFMGSKKDGFEVDSLLRYYGSGFEYIAVGANKITGLDNSKQEFNVRHIFAQIFGIVALLFAGLISRKIAGWKGALFTIWLLFLSPSFFGHVYFNSKDIPFCAGYIATLYYIFNFLEELPNPSWKTTVSLMLAFAFTTSIRIGGLLLFFYMGLFAVIYILFNRKLLPEILKNVKELALKIATVVGGGMALVIVTWPFLLRNPIKNLPATLTVIKRFPMKVTLNFEGVYMDSLRVPSHYIPKYLLITAPLVVLALIFAGVSFYLLKFAKRRNLLGFFILFAVCFPVIYAIISNAALYSGWRHFIFIYPGLCIIATIGITEILGYVKKPALQGAFILICLIGLARPVLWGIRNHPYEYTYFNEIAGGLKTAFSGYETDYWEITVKNSVDWLMKSEDFTHIKDSVTLASNVYLFTKNYIHKQYPGSKIRFISSGVTGRNSLTWTYAIYNSLFLKPEYLDNYFPPQPCIHTENIDDVPMTAVLKDTLRLDLKGLAALKLSNHKLADSCYTEYLRLTKDNNPANYAYISVAKGSLGQNDEAIDAANKCIQYNISNVLDYNAYCGLGIGYGNKGEFEKSINALKKAESLMPNEHYSKDILRQVYAAQRAVQSGQR